MKKIKTSISQAEFHIESGEYWDTHDLSKFWDKTKDTTFEIDIQSESTYYALDKSLSEQIRLIAQKRGISADTLVNLWMQEKLLQQ